MYSLFLQHLPKGIKQFEGVNKNNGAADAVDPLHMAGAQILAAGFEDACKPENHRQEAAATPLIKSEAVSAGSDERKAPSISVPSITACGLNQVTVKASVAVCHSVGWL